MGFELRTLVVIGTDWTGSKYNYHTFTTTTARNSIEHIKKRLLPPPTFFFYVHQFLENSSDVLIDAVSHSITNVAC
jgi:hypothetical protein